MLTTLLQRPLGVPAFMYRQAMESAVASAKFDLVGDKSEAFEREANLLSCIGFIKQRWKIYLSGLR